MKKSTTKTGLTDSILDKVLDDSDLVFDTELRSSTAKNVRDWAVEIGKLRLLERLINIFGCSLATSCVFIAVGVVNPNVNTDFILKITPKIILPQTGLLATLVPTYIMAGRKPKDPKTKPD